MGGGGNMHREQKDESYELNHQYEQLSTGYQYSRGVNPVQMVYGTPLVPVYMSPTVIAPRELPPYVSSKKNSDHQHENDTTEHGSKRDTREDPITKSSSQRNQVCQFFVKNGSCAYGSSCKFQHPLELAPPVFYNSFGLPIRRGEPPCKFFLKYKRCAYGHTCRYNHPEIHGQQFMNSNSVSNALHSQRTWYS